MLSQKTLVKNILQSPLNRFLKEVNKGKYEASPSNSTDIEKFLNSLRDSKKEDQKKLLSNEEVQKINLQIKLRDSMSLIKKERSKWSAEEKNLLLWAIFYFMKMNKKGSEEMVSFFRFL